MATKEKSTGNSLVELVVIVAVALGLALGIQAFLVKPYRIPSESMVPTLQINQRILVNRIGNNFGDPSRGDIVVFHPPTNAVDADLPKCGAPGGSDENRICPVSGPKKADTNFVKRLIGLPGDKVQIRDGKAIVNGKPLDEPYAEPCEGGSGCTFPGEITVPKDHYFFMGDNRGFSDDSRFWGPIPRDWIIGGAFATYWPPNRIGLL